MFRKVIVSTALLFMLAPGRASAQVQYPPESTTTTTQPGATTTTTAPGGTTTTAQPPGATTTTRAAVAPTVPRVNPPRVGGVLAKTGADGVAGAVRIGMILLVGGFLFYLVGRNRRAARTRGDSA